MPPNLQVKLLRTLQEYEIKPLGSNKVRKVNTRVVSATNCNLEEEIKEGRFREDLYYRLGVVILEVPPLRERPEDVELLANYFVKRHAMDSDKTPPQLLPDALKLLQSYEWPGNVRELENVIERAMIFSDGKIGCDSIELGTAQEASSETTRALQEIASEAAKSAEIQAITRALAQTKGNKTKAARLLGVSYKTLLNKVKDYGINEKAP
jgi:transcriptional regulator with PAS, ATPase and Fis domain